MGYNIVEEIVEENNSREYQGLTHGKANIIDNTVDSRGDLDADYLKVRKVQHEILYC